MNTLGYYKLTGYAYAPMRATELSAGYDLRSAYNCVVPAQGKALIKTDLAISLPQGTYGRIAPRSGLAHKHFIDVGAGVIDRDYTGNVCVVLFNHSLVEFKIKRGDRIAQIICERIIEPDIVELNCPPVRTERGNGGFGSTGS